MVLAPSLARTGPVASCRVLGGLRDMMRAGLLVDILAVVVVVLVATVAVPWLE